MSLCLLPLEVWFSACLLKVSNSGMTYNLYKQEGKVPLVYAMNDATASMNYTLQMGKNSTFLIFVLGCMNCDHASIYCNIIALEFAEERASTEEMKTPSSDHQLMKDMFSVSYLSFAAYHTRVYAY